MIEKNKILKKSALVFLATFIITTIILLQSRPLDPASFNHPGSDSHYYYQLAVSFSKVFKEPFYYIPALISKTLSERELLEIGFNKNSDFDSFSRAPVYITYLGLWIALFGVSKISLIFSQSFLIGLMSVGVFAILLNFISFPLALAGVFFNLFYLSYYTSASITMSENIQIAIVPFLFLVFDKICIKEKISKKDLLLYAFLIVCISFSKNAMKYLGFFIVIFSSFFIFSSKKEDIKILKKEILFFILFFVLFYFIAQRIVSQSTPSGPDANIGGWRNFYAGSMIDTDGYNLNTGFHCQEFRNSLVYGKDQFWFNRYSQVCKYAVLAIFRSNPIAFLSLTVRKFSLLNLFPPCNGEGYNLFKTLRKYFLTYFHWFILFICFVSFLVHDNRKIYLKFFVLLFIVYIGGLFSLSNTDSRYMITVVPLKNILAWLFLIDIVNKKVNFTKIYIFLSVIMLIVSFILFHPVWIFRFFSSLFLIRLIRFLNLLILTLIMFPFLVKEKEKFLKLEFFLSFFVILLFFLVGGVWVWSDKYLNHFPLDKKFCKQKIIFSEKPSVKSDNEFFVAVDVTFSSPEDVININVNGKFDTSIKADKTQKTLFEEMEPIPERYKSAQWCFIKIPAEIVSVTNIISVSVSDKAKIWGSMKDDKKRPSFFHFTSNLENLIFGPGSQRERRLFLPFYTASLQRDSYSRFDANIFIILKTRSSYYVKDVFSELNDANIKFIALCNPVDNNMVVWKDSPPLLQEQLKPVRGNLMLYLFGEFDRLRTGITIF